MTTLMRATLFAAATAAAALFAQPVLSATVQPRLIVSDGESAKIIDVVRRRGGGGWGRRGGWGHRGGYWRRGGWGNRGFVRRGWGHRGWGWRRGGWGYRRWGWGGPRFYGGGYGCGPGAIGGATAGAVSPTDMGGRSSPSDLATAAGGNKATEHPLVLKGVHSFELRPLQCRAVQAA